MCLWTLADEDFSILLANRSAALYHMQKYDLALQDIELAEENYPKEMMYKLKERSARCHLANKHYEKALNAFKYGVHSCFSLISKFIRSFTFRENITHLDSSKLPMEKRGKLEKDAQIMIKMLPQQVEYEKKMNKCSGEKRTANPLKIPTKLHKSLEFDYNEQEGRFTKTNRNMKVGEEVLVEGAICATLMEKFSKSHCQQCFARTIIPLPCPNCVDVVFCSKTCQNASIYTYHKFECGLLDTIWNSGSSINCQMAMRLVSQRPLSYFRNIRKELKDTLTIDEINK